MPIIIFCGINSYRMIDWLIVGCLTSSGIYFMHIQDENKLTINTIDRSWNNRGQLGWWSGKFGLPLENEGILDRDRNFALQQATYGPLKEFLQGFLTCKEGGTLFTRGIGFNVPNLTGRDCELNTSRTAKRKPHFGKRFTAGRKKTKWTYVYSPVTLGVYIHL